MEQNEFKKGIEEMRGIKMTSLEKDHMIESIFNSSSKEVDGPVPSPYSMNSFFVMITSNRLVYSASVFCLVVILGGGAVFASSDSLPGSKFYPLKVRVVEPIGGAFIFSPIEKIQYENTLATERLIEAGILASEGQLDDSKKEELNFLLKNHTIAFNNAVDKFYENNPKEDDSSLGEESITAFKAKMEVYPKILDIIIKPKEIGNISEENSDTNISTTAKEVSNEEGDRDVPRQESPKKREYKGYKERKNAIQLLIDKTTNDIINQGSKERIEDTEKAPDDARNNTLENDKEIIQELKKDDMSTDSKEEDKDPANPKNSMVDVEVFLRTGLGL